MSDSTDPWRERLQAAIDENVDLRARLAQAEATITAMAKHDAANQRGYVESRRSICDQSDRYKAERDAAVVAVARGLALCDAAGAGNVIQPDGWLLSPEAVRAALVTDTTEQQPHWSHEQNKSSVNMRRSVGADTTTDPAEQAKCPTCGGDVWTKAELDALLQRSHENWLRDRDLFDDGAVPATESTDL